MVINCFGDSLTAGTAFGNTTPYPMLLEKITGIKTNNYGIGGESSHTIAMRIGAHNFFTGEDIQLVEYKNKILLVDEHGLSVNILRQVKEDTGVDLINPVTIGDYEGVLTRAGEDIFFESKGSLGKIPKGTKVTTILSQEKYSDAINIFWAGTNDYTGLDNVEQVISNIKDMIKYAGSERYIVIGLTALSYMPEVARVNQIMEQEFKEHFYDFRKYLLSLDVTDEADKEDIARGDVPVSLIKAPRYDHVHGNEKFFALLAGEISRKLKKIKYI